MFRQSVWGPSSFPEYSWFFFYEGINPQRFKCSIQGSHKNATILVSRAWVSLSHFPLQVSQDNNHLYGLVVSNTYLPRFLLSWASVLIKVGLQPSLCHRAVVPGDSDDIAAHHYWHGKGQVSRVIAIDIGKWPVLQRPTFFLTLWGNSCSLQWAECRGLSLSIISHPQRPHSCAYPFPRGRNWVRELIRWDSQQISDRNKLSAEQVLLLQRLWQLSFKTVRSLQYL